MPSFSQKSKTQLSTCHSDLQLLFNMVIKSYDCVVLEGFRGEEKQNKAYDEGKSKLKWPNSNHNKYPCRAVDVSPYPIDWNDWKKFYHFIGYVQACATILGIKIRTGADWNMDGDFKDNKFNDLVHFELVD